MKSLFIISLAIVLHGCSAVEYIVARDCEPASGDKAIYVCKELK